VRLRDRSGRALSFAIDRAERRLQQVARALDDVGPLDRIERAGERVAQLSDDLARAALARVQGATSALGELNLLLGALSPQRVLARGYAIVAGDGGRAVRSWRDAPVGTSLHIRLAQGAVRATVTERAKEATDGEA
jgi:exodeoxyribonuclease VII large subunit